MKGMKCWQWNRKKKMVEKSEKREREKRKELGVGGREEKHKG